MSYTETNTQGKTLTEPLGRTPCRENPDLSLLTCVLYGELPTPLRAPRPRPERPPVRVSALGPLLRPAPVLLLWATFAGILCSVPLPVPLALGIEWDT